MSKRLQDPSPATTDGDTRYACVLAAWREHEQELRGFLVTRMGDQEAAEELVQEVFLRAMNEGAGFCRLDNPRAWLFRVARNAATDRQRRTRPVEPVSEDIARSEPETPPVDELRACIARNLPMLREQDRVLLEACDLQGQPHQRYAAAHGLSVAAVKTRLFRARQRLRHQLIERCRVQFDEQGGVCCHAAPEGDLDNTI